MPQAKSKKRGLNLCQFGFRAWALRSMFLPLWYLLLLPFAFKWLKIIKTHITKWILIYSPLCLLLNRRQQCTFYSVAEFVPEGFDSTPWGSRWILSLLSQDLWLFSDVYLPALPVPYLIVVIILIITILFSLHFLLYYFLYHPVLDSDW